MFKTEGGLLVYILSTEMFENLLKKWPLEGVDVSFSLFNVRSLGL